VPRDCVLVTVVVAVQEKKEDMVANCFICQIERAEFDRSAEGFAKHIRSDHNLCVRDLCARWLNVCVVRLHVCLFLCVSVCVCLCLCGCVCGCVWVAAIVRACP
jgi:hypothetical protein